MAKDRKFSREELIEILDAAMGKTLGEVDVNHVFDKTINHPKITGIAGDVVEQSVLGFDADNLSEPDINVDGELIEVKTTGIRKSKTDATVLEAKEPMSITAVSPNTIVTETFYESKFWHKIRKMLLVYYEYASYKTVAANEYADFFLRGYDIYEFSKYDRKILKSDWELVQKFLIYLREQPDFEDIEYSRLSHELRDKLLYIDTAPKWPNPPRFRLKRSVVTAIVQEHFTYHPFEHALEEISGMASLDTKCRILTKKYNNKTMKELADLFGVKITFDRNGNPNKSIAEKIVVRMFGGQSEKINSLDLFAKAGIMGKTIVLTNEGGRTEDTKLFTIDFDEWLSDEVAFEDSQIYDYFANHQLLCIQFEETVDGDLLQSIFVGFKRLTFSEDFINIYAKRVWDLVRITVKSGSLRETICRRKDGSIIYNPSGTVKTEINFPKSSDKMILFLRGTGLDSTRKTLVLCGVRMYQQQVWIRGLDIIELLNNKEYL